jgi:serine/threonine-protein kinase HipA
MTRCLICLDEHTGKGEYHPACIERLFGTARLPALEFDLKDLYALAAQMAGKMSISGIEEKVSLRLSPDRSKLEVAATGGRYILKPQPSRFSAVPENEHVSMKLATIVGIETPPFGLMRLKDGSITYIVKRFDRLDDGTKLQVEDFCQLGEKRLKDKYEGSAELCVRILRKYASEPLLEISKLYRLFLFGWWIASGDMHLKNFSLLTLPDRLRKLAPAYDLVCTRLAIPNDDSLALPIGGKAKSLTRRLWLEFGECCGIPKRAAASIIAEQIGILKASLQLIGRSLLPEKQKQEYEGIIRANTDALAEKQMP